MICAFVFTIELVLLGFVSNNDSIKLVLIRTETDVPFVVFDYFL